MIFHCLSGCGQQHKMKLREPQLQNSLQSCLLSTSLNDLMISNILKKTCLNDYNPQLVRIFTCLQQEKAKSVHFTAYEECGVTFQVALSIFKI